MTHLIHAMIRVLDENRSVEFYGIAFGLSINNRYDFDDFTLVYLGNTDRNFEIELTVNHGRDAPYEHGSGFGHLAVAIDDLEAEHERLTSVGLEPTPIKDLFNNGVLLARFFFIVDPDGYKIEMLQNFGRYQYQPAGGH